ncbi:MAG TPA: histidine kinase [Kineosporiaceae bacterium]|nr:histidine kinase [Kineosporiaceae bacterium]
MSTSPATPSAAGTPGALVPWLPPERQRLLPEHPGLLPAALLGRPTDPQGTPPRRSGRDWFIDTTCFVLALGLGILLFATSPDRHDVSPIVLWLDAISGTLSCFALWWRRRWPVEIAVAAALVATFSIFAAIAGLIALFTVAVHRRSRPVAAVAALNVAGGAAFMVLRPDPTTPVYLTAMVVVLATAGTVAWGMFVRARRQLVMSLHERAERAEAEQQLRVDQARQLERNRIAREMHDVLAHRISLVSMHAGALEFRAEAVGGEVARSAAVIRSSAHQALEDLREVIGILRDGVHDDAPERPQPTLADVPCLIEESQQAGMHVTLRFTVPDTVDGLPLSVGRTAYRIVQEGLTNARKHAPGAAVVVDLHGNPGPGVTLEIRSRRPIETRAEPVIPGAGQGLVGLAERADLAGGQLEHGRLPNGDFRLGAWLPWPA